nr:hypothetical protein [Mycoplasmopsis bovis]
MTIKFIVKDKKTIELLQDAKKGDQIDLSNAESVDLSFITKEIDEARDRLYNEKIKKEKELLFAQYQVNLTKANNELRQELSRTIIDQKDKITKLELQISNFEEKHKLDTKVKVTEAIQSQNNTIIALNDKVKDLMYKISLLEVKHKNEISNKIIEANKLNEQIEKIKQSKAN